MSEPAALSRAPALRLNPATHLRWREFDGEWVVYDAGSGQTHHLDAFSATVLTLIESAPLSEGQLLATLAEHLGAADPGPLPATLSSILQQLEALGLIELVAA